MRAVFSVRCVTIISGCFAILLLFLPRSTVAAARADDGPIVLNVHVLDSQDLPVPGTSVQVTSALQRQTRVTDSNGSVAIATELPASLEVQANGFEPQALAITSPPPGLLEIRLVPAVYRAKVDVVVRESPIEESASVGSALVIDPTAARTVFDAIDGLLPSVTVTRRGVMGYGIGANGTGGISIRGIGGQPNTQVLVVVDGRPDVQGLMGHPLPDAYLLSDVDDVSVTPGPASVLYGSNAMGGVIEMKMTRPLPGTHAHLVSSLGSYTTGQHRLTQSFVDVGRFLTLSAAVDHTRGDRPSSAYRGETITLRAGAAFSENWKAAVQGRFTDFRVEDPGPVGTPLAGSAATVDRGGFSADVSNAKGRTWGYARGYASFGHHVITDGFRSVDRAIGARIQQAFALGGRTVVEAGTEVRQSGGRARDVHAHVDYGEHWETEAAVFGRVQHAAAANLSLHAGVRHDRSSLSRNVFVPEFGGTYRPGGRTAVAVSVARGFRNPTIRELFLFPAPNPLLGPEHVWNTEVSVELRPVPALGLTTSAYYARVDNLIVVEGRFPGLALRNSGRAVNLGVESTIEWRLAAPLRLYAGYAHLRSANRAPLVPARKLTWGVNASVPRFTVNVGGTVVGSRWADSRHSSSLDTYAVTSLKATYQTRPGTSIFATVDNLLNVRCQLVAGYPMPGINAAAGLTWGF